MYKFFVAVVISFEIFSAYFVLSSIPQFKKKLYQCTVKNEIQYATFLYNEIKRYKWNDRRELKYAL